MEPSLAAIARRRILLLAAGAIVASVAACRSNRMPCTFIPVEDGARDVVAACARRAEDGRIVVEAAALDVLRRRADEPAAVLIGDTIHYLNARGVAVPVVPFDNGADPFVEGLARTVRAHKVGFIDRTLAVVIEPRWDFALPFDSGAAAVCDGCAFRTGAGGHTEVLGGRWGVIDRGGQVVVPLVHSREEIRALRRKPR